MPHSDDVNNVWFYNLLRSNIFSYHARCRDLVCLSATLHALSGKLGLIQGIGLQMMNGQPLFVFVMGSTQASFSRFALRVG